MAADLYALSLTLTPDGMVSGGKVAEQALNKIANAADNAAARVSAFGQQFRQGAQGLLLPSNAEQFLTKTEAAAEGTTRGLGKVERALGSLALSSVGAENAFGRLGESLLAFGAGGEVVIGVAAGLAVIGLAWEAITASTREAREEAEKYAQSEAVKQAQAGSASRIGQPNATESQAGKDLLATQKAFVDLGGEIDGAVGRVDRAFAENRISAAEWEAQLKKLKEEDPLNSYLQESIEKATKAGDAFAIAKKAYQDLVGVHNAPLTVFSGQATTPDDFVTKAVEQSRQLLELKTQQRGLEADLLAQQEGGNAVLEHGVQLAKQIRDATQPLLDQAAAERASRNANGDEMARELELEAKLIEAQIRKNDLLKVEVEGYKATNQLLADMHTKLHDELANDAAKMAKEGTDSVGGFVGGEIQGLKTQAAQIQEEAERPFREAFREAQRDVGDFFDYVLNGGTNAFKHLADSVRQIWTRMLAEMAETALAKNIFGAQGLAALGISVPPGYISGVHGASLGALAVAGVSGSVGYGVGGMTTNSGLGALGGAASGAATGAMIGSVIPGLGTAVGAFIGGVVGGIGGLFGSSAAKHAAEVQRALKEQDEAYTREDAHVRALRAAGMDQEASAAELALQHEKELNDARQKGYDAATLAAITFAQAAENAQEQWAAAVQVQQDAFSGLQNESKVFGYSDAETYARALKILGFGGMTIDQIKAGYTLNAGQELTNAQKDYNQRVEELLSLGGAPGASSSTTLGGVSQISAAQSDAVLGILTSQLMYLSRIATAVEALAGISGGLNPIGGVAPARSIDSALSAAAMNRRAAVGAVRTPATT